MLTPHAVTEAIACRDSTVKYTPHSAKHIIGAERDERPLTQIQRKGWSANMGYDNEQTTERHYGKLTDDRRLEVMEQIGANDRGDALEFSNEEKIALFDSMLEMIRNR